jgi:hypothetical protein
MCTNPYCKFPGEKAGIGVQWWYPRCGWPLTNQCPECQRALSKDIARYKQCTCGENLRWLFADVHLFGALRDEIQKINEPESLAYLNELMKKIHYFLPDEKQIESFWTLSKKEIIETICKKSYENISVYDLKNYTRH